MENYVVDTNLFITGFQSRPDTFKKFAQALKQLNIQVLITNAVKNEMRYYLQREIKPHVKIRHIENDDFQLFLKKIHRITTSLPQKPDLTVISLADKIQATIVSSDLKLLETAELIGLKTLTNSAFAKLVAKTNQDSSLNSFLHELESKLFAEEIRYSVASTNRYDPVKRIKKIMDSAISVIRAEYEQKMSQAIVSDLKQKDTFSIEALQLQELLVEIRSDFTTLEQDFQEEKYADLEEEILCRVREITDFIVDWKLAVNIIEDHPIYNDALVLLGRLQYLACICLIENQKVELARVYMDKLMMILFQNAEAVNDYGIDVHFLRMIILLLSNQINRLTSYFTVAFEEECQQYQRCDVSNIIRALILLTVVLGKEGVEDTSDVGDFDSIEFINQLGFKFMQLKQLKKANLMFEQTFYLSLNSDNKGLCIASIEYLSWLYFSGLESVKPTIEKLYTKLTKRYPNIKASYRYNLSITSNESVLQKFETTDFVSIDKIPKAIKASNYCIGIRKAKIKSKTVPLIRVMNWDIMARIGIIDESNVLEDKSSLGAIIYLVDGKFKITKATKYFRNKYGIEFILTINRESSPLVIVRSTSGWDASILE